MVSLKRLVISTVEDDQAELSLPGIPIEAHDDTLDSSSFGNIRTFVEQLVYLLLCCVEA